MCFLATPVITSESVTVGPRNTRLPQPIHSVVFPTAGQAATGLSGGLDALYRFKESRGGTPSGCLMGGESASASQ